MHDKKQTRFVDKLTQYKFRALYGAIGSVLGFLLIIANVYILGMLGFPLFVISFYGLLFAFFDKKKYNYVTTLKIQLSQEKQIPCMVIKERDYTIFLMPPFCYLVPFFYWIPYRTVYHIIRNVSGETSKPDSLVSEYMVYNSSSYCIFEVTPSEFKQIQANPSLLANRLIEENDKNRNNFLKTVEFSLNNNILKEEWFDESVSICSLKNDDSVRLLAYYSGNIGEQCAVLITKEESERIKADPGYAPSIVLSSDDRILFDLRKDIEKYLKLSSDELDEEANEIISRLEQQKKPLTDELIQTQLTKAAKSKMTLYIILTVVLVSPTGVASLLTPALCLVPLIALILLFMFPIKKYRKKCNQIKSKQYSVIKTKCVKYEYDDNEYKPVLTVAFENGSHVNKVFEGDVLDEGDFAYLVYLNSDNSKKAKKSTPICFSAMTFNFPEDRLTRC